MSGVLGPVVPLPRISRAVIAHVKRWLPTYLREIERQEGVRADGETPLAAGDLQLPRSWVRAQGAPEKWPEDQLPAIIYGSPGLSGKGTTRDGRGLYSGWFAFGLTAVAGGRDQETTQWLAGMYVSALIVLLAQHAPEGEDLSIGECRWTDLATGDIAFSRSRSISAATATFEMEIHDMASARDGLSEPADDPIPDPGVFPVVQTTGLEVDRS